RTTTVPSSRSRSGSGSRLPPVGADLAEGQVGVDLWLLGEPEDALADDVALDLVGPPGDGPCWHGDDDLGDDAAERGRRTRQHGVGAGHRLVGPGRGPRQV